MIEMLHLPRQNLYIKKFKKHPCGRHVYIVDDLTAKDHREKTNGCTRKFDVLDRDKAAIVKRIAETK